MQLGVERLAGGVVGLDARPREDRDKVAVDELDALAQGIVLGSVERPLQVVDDGHQLAAEAGPSALLRLVCLPFRALAVVLEVRLRPLRELEVLVPLALNVGEQRVEVVLDLLGRILGARLDLLSGLRALVIDDLGVDDLLLAGAVGGSSVRRVAGRGRLLLGRLLVDLLGDLVEGGLECVGLRLDLLGVA